VILRFHEEFELPAAEVYSFFRSPTEWPRIFGFAGAVEDRGEGWYAVPLHRFPFPLVARMTRDEPERHLRWEFRGFWRGEGEARLAPTASGGVAVDGSERIGVRWLGPLSWVVEKLFLERGFRRVWAVGWQRLRKLESASRGPAVAGEKGQRRCSGSTC